MMLLAISLWPDFGVFAGLVIAIHWFWLFVIRKGRTTTGHSNTGYQTGGGHKSPSITSLEDTDIFSRPSLGFIGHESVSGNESISEDLPAPSMALVENEKLSKEVDPTTAPPSGQSRYEEDIRNKYAEVNLISVLNSLSSGQLSPAALNEMESLATLTRSTESAYPYAMDKARKFLSEYPGSMTSSPGNPQPPVLFQ